jgi:hypothetical protein
MNDEYSAANDRYVIHDTNYAKPSTRYVSDPKGNVFKISDLSKKQIEGHLEFYKKRIKISLARLRNLYGRYYSMNAEQFPKVALLDKLHLERKLARDAGFTLSPDFRAALDTLDSLKEDRDFAERQKQVINLTILQLENGADTDLILKILKQSQVEAEK